MCLSTKLAERLLYGIVVGLFALEIISPELLSAPDFILFYANLAINHIPADLIVIYCCSQILLHPFL